MTNAPDQPEAGSGGPLEAGVADGGADLGGGGPLGFTAEVGGTPPGTLDPDAGEQTLSQSARDAADEQADAAKERP